MAEIIVAGAGHGGIAAALRLAKAGYSVTVYEKEKKGEVGLNQRDAFTESSFESLGIDVPESFRAMPNRLTFVPLDSSVEPLTMPVKDDVNALCAERRDLINYMLMLAEKAGVKIIYGCRVLAPMVLGSRVVGIVTDRGKFFADLVIDACGVNSPLRMRLPDFMHIQKELKEFDILHGYRAYFNRVEGESVPETDYNIYLKDDGTVGLSWLITGEDDVDVLVARFGKITADDIDAALAALHKENTHMGTELLREAGVHDIPVRQPLAVFVADGYAAVGDSACMTYPVKGSGIDYSLRAGAMLANAVEADTDGLYNAETLWEYEKEFFKEIGYDACRLALLKNLLPYVTAQEVSDLFAEKIITSDELEKLTSDTLSTLLNAKGILAAREKIKLLNNHPESRGKLLNMIKWFGKLAVTEPFFPGKYDRGAVEKWADKYNEMFESISYKRPVTKTV